MKMLVVLQKQTLRRSSQMYKSQIQHKAHRETEPWKVQCGIWNVYTLWYCLSDTHKMHRVLPLQMSNSAETLIFRTGLLNKDTRTCRLNEGPLTFFKEKMFKITFSFEFLSLFGECLHVSSEWGKVGITQSWHPKPIPTTRVVTISTMPSSQNCLKLEIQSLSPRLFRRNTLAAFVINSNSNPYVSEKLFNNALLPNDFTNKTGIDEFQFGSRTARSTSQYWALRWRMAALIKSPGESLIMWGIMALAANFKAGWKYPFQKQLFHQNGTQFAALLIPLKINYPVQWFMITETISSCF